MYYQMNFKFNVLNRIISLTLAATVTVGASASVCAVKGQKKRPVHKAKMVELANRKASRRVDGSVIHKDAVDKILKKIESTGFDLEYAVRKYREAKDSMHENKHTNSETYGSMFCHPNVLMDHFNQKKSVYVIKNLLKEKMYIESLNKFENDIKMSEDEYVRENNVLENGFKYNYNTNANSRQMCFEEMSKLKDEIGKLKNEYIGQYDALLREFYSLKADVQKYLHEPENCKAIKDQIDIVRNKIISTKTQIYKTNANFSSCGLYDFFIKFNTNGFISYIGDENSTGFNESIQAINILNSQLEKAISSDFAKYDEKNVDLFLNVVSNNFKIIDKNLDNLDLDLQAQIALKLLNIKSLLNIIDKNFKIYEKNNNIINLLDRAKNIISQYIYEFFRFNSINYMLHEDIDNYLPIFVDNEYIYNSRNIKEFEQSIFDIFKLTNKKLLDHKYCEMVNLPENSENSKQIIKDACRLVVSDLKISIANILGRLDNRLNLDENSILKISEYTEKIIENIKYFNMHFNNNQNKDKLNVLCNSLSQVNLKLAELKNELKNQWKNNMNMEYDKNKICSLINFIYFELDRIFTQEIDDVFKLNK